MIDSRPHRVAAVAYDGLCTFEFGCTVELFALSRPELGVAWYDFAVCAAERGPLRAAGGIVLHAPYTLSLLDRADTIVIPGWRDADDSPPAPLLRKLKRAHERGARPCSICSGVFVLAAAGVLEGRTVTTHWRYAEKLAARYPHLRVEPNALYVEDGSILTSAGSAAGLDMLLHVVRRDYGARVANHVARRLVIPPQRDGGQAQYVPRPVSRDERGRIAKLMDAVREHPARPYTLGELAALAAMSPRTLQRQFKDAVGCSPGEWVVRERVAQARERHETGSESLARIVDAVGFGSVESFRRHFRRVTGTSPTAYRRQFALRSRF
jgi:AraC family transcriptional regulator, transcriptional activator FtrA